MNVSLWPCIARALPVNAIFLFFLLLIPGLSFSQTITSVSPTTICQGENVTITGSGFTGATGVKLGSRDAAAFTVQNDATIVARVDDGAGNGTVTVTTPAGTATATQALTVLPAPRPALTDKSAIDAPFTNCNGNAVYTLTVQNSSLVNGAGNAYDINWGDNTAHFTQNDWPANAQISHTYTSQGYYLITVTITPPNGCKKVKTYQFYNGQNPLASFTTTSSTTGLCAPAPIEFQVGNWYNNSAGTSYIFNWGDGSPDVTLQHPLDLSNVVRKQSHTYVKSSCPAAVDFTATLKASNGCFTTTYTLNQIIIRKKPEAAFTTNPIQPCINTQVCFSNQSINGSSGNSTCQTTTAFEWDFGDNTPKSSLRDPCHTYATAGTYTVTLKATNASCGDDIETKQITVLPNSPAPTVVTPVNYCQGRPATALTATGVNLTWYNSSMGGTALPAAPVPSTTTAVTRTWYVSQTLPNSCESGRVPVTVTVTALPAAPAVTSPVQLCQGQAAGPLTASGNNLLWYTAASGGTGSAAAPIPATTTVGNTTYYVSQLSNSCEGPRAAIVVSVNAPAVAPTVTTPITYCQFQTATPLTASGANLRWYTVATGGTGATTAPTPSTTTAGSTTWYVSQASGCGESPRVAITVNVDAAPVASIVYATPTLCNVAGSPSATVTQTGAGGGVYSVAPATGLSVNTTTGELNPSGATPGTYTIRYTVPGSGSCGVAVFTTTVTVNATPSATISYPAVCSSSGPVSVVLTGTSGGSFSAGTGLSINAATGVITPATSTPGAYTVTYAIAAAGPCPAYSTSAQVTITQAPVAAISYLSTTLCNFIHSATTPNPTVPVTQTGTTGGTYSINPATGLTIDFATGALQPSGATPGTYTIRYTVLGTGGCPNGVFTTTVTVNSTPSATIQYPPVCSSSAAVPVLLTGSAGGSFSAASGLVIDAATGTISASASTPGTYTVTYVIAAAGPCPGFTTLAPVTITQAPAATISYTPATLCNSAHSATNPNGPVGVTQTGTTGGTYSISPANGLPIDATTGMLQPSGATAGTYTIRYTVTGTGGCANFSTTTTVTVNSTPIATISYPGSPYCGALNTPQAVSLTGTAGGVFTAGAGLSLNATTGAIDPSASTPGNYTVTYTISPSAPCPGYTTSTSVTITESPVITFPLPAQSICSGSTATYTPTSSVANTSYAWSIVGSLPAGITGVSAGTAGGNNPSIALSFTNTGSASQMVTVGVTPSNPAANPCGGAPYQLTLVIHPVPPAPLTDTTHLCMQSPPVALQQAPMPNTTIKWYDQQLQGLPGAPVVPTDRPRPFTYYVSHNSQYGCESSKTEKIAVVHPVAKIVGTDYHHPTACGNPSGSIVLHVLDLNNDPLPNLPVLVHYTKFQIALSAPLTTDAAGKITIPLTAGTYSNIRVETSGGCTSQPVPDVFILKDPNPPVQPVAGYNPPLCSEQPLRMTASTATSAQNGPIDYVWAGPAFGPYADTIKNTVVTFPSASMAHAGTYVVYAVQNNCISLPVSFQVEIKQSPSKPVINTRLPLCVGDELFLQAFSSMPGNTGLNFVWKGPGAGFPVNSANAGIAKVKVDDSGIYSITVTSPVTGCSTTTDTLIQVGDFPVVRFAQDTLTFPAGYRFLLQPKIVNATAPGVAPIRQYAWTPTSDLDCNDAICSEPTLTVKKDGCYTVNATNVYGCSGRDEICFKVFCQNSQVFVPNAFTPRGNVAANNRLTIRATGVASVKTFRVFNRWGRVVFEKNNFAPNNPAYGWDGMFNGKLADTGVYIYTVDVICENGVPYTYKGNVTLL